MPALLIFLFLERYPWLVQFEIIGELRVVETIASGRGVRDRRRLNQEHGKGVWRKMKGIATVRLADGTICDAELP